MTGVSMLVAALLTVQVPSAENPVAAAGITLQTLAAWLLLGMAAVRLPFDWMPVEALAWLVAIPALLIFVTGVVAYILAMFMYVGSLFIGRELAPDGEALTALQSRLNANDWIWPIVGLVFVLCGMLQVAAA